MPLRQSVREQSTRGPSGGFRGRVHEQHHAVDPVAPPGHLAQPSANADFQAHEARLRREQQQLQQARAEQEAQRARDLAQAAQRAQEHANMEAPVEQGEGDLARAMVTERDVIIEYDIAMRRFDGDRAKVVEGDLACEQREDIEKLRMQMVSRLAARRRGKEIIKPELFDRVQARFPGPEGWDRLVKKVLDEHKDTDEETGLEIATYVFAMSDNIRLVESTFRDMAKFEDSEVKTWLTNKKDEIDESTKAERSKARALGRSTNIRMLFSCQECPGLGRVKRGKKSRPLCPAHARMHYKEEDGQLSFLGHGRLRGGEFRVNKPHGDGCPWGEIQGQRINQPVLVEAQWLLGCGQNANCRMQIESMADLNEKVKSLRLNEVERCQLEVQRNAIPRVQPAQPSPRRTPTGSPPRTPCTLSNRESRQQDQDHGRQSRSASPARHNSPQQQRRDRDRSRDRFSSGGDDDASGGDGDEDELLACGEAAWQAA